MMPGLLRRDAPRFLEVSQAAGVVLGHDVTAGQVHVVVAPSYRRHRWSQAYFPGALHGLVAVFQFDGDSSLGMALSDNPVEVLRGCQIRDAAMHFAIPARDFLAQVPSVK